MFDFLKGKRTYIIAIIGAALSIADAFGYVVPPQVYGVLAALGLYTLRAGVEAAAE